MWGGRAFRYVSLGTRLSLYECHYRSQRKTSVAVALCLVFESDCSRVLAGVLQACWPVEPPSPIVTQEQEGHRPVLPHLALHVFWGFEPGPHTYRANALLSETSLKRKDCFVVVVVVEHTNTMRFCFKIVKEQC